MARTFVLVLAALFCLTAQTPPPPAPSQSAAAQSEWTSLGANLPGLGFRLGCIVVPSQPADSNSKELAYFKNDSDKAYDLDAGFSPDGTTEKIVYFHMKLDPGSVGVTFFGFLRPCGADKMIYWNNVVPTRQYFTPQRQPAKNAVWLSCTISSHTITASNGASMVVPVGNGNGGIYAYNDKDLTVYAYDPPSKTASETAATFEQNDVTWFYGSTNLKYDLNRKTFALTRIGQYQEQSNLVTPPDVTLTDSESGQCQKISAPA